MKKGQINSGSFKKGQTSPRKGKKLSEESRKKISAGLKRLYASGFQHPMKGKHQSEEARRKIGLAGKGRPSVWKGKHLPEETRRKIGLAAKGRKVSEETRRKLSKKFSGKNNPRYGKKLSKEHKEKLRIAHIGKPGYWTGKKRSEETRRKISEKQKGKKLSEEHKEKIRLANIGREVTEETRKKIAIKNKENTKQFWKNLTESQKAERVKGPGFIKKGQKLALGFIQSDEHKRKNSKGHRYSVYPKDDTKPEKILQALLTAKGIKFEKHTPFKTSGRPWYHKVDLFIQPNICIEAYGDFVHANPNAKNADGSMKYPDDRVMRKAYKYSKEKTGESIRAKDERITKELEQQGNVVLTFWQSELETEPEKCLQKILKAIK